MQRAIVLCVLAISTSLDAQIIRVPSQRSTIQAALSSAGPGTLILVSPGTYKERILWPAVDGIRVLATGPGVIIDAERKGRVVTFQPGITRKTVLQGCTITGGFLKESNERNWGSGIFINGRRGICSPTIRGNRITGNRSDGTAWNYGGGIKVDGQFSNPKATNPLIIGNEIDNNELLAGSWNYGAGIYVSSSATAEIVGNRIHDNRVPFGSRGHGGGIWLGGQGTIACNLIYNNTCKATSWNYGGGVGVTRGPRGTAVARIVNNTIVGNVCNGGVFTGGGGINLEVDEANMTVEVIGNIVARNIVGGGVQSDQGGGIRFSRVFNRYTPVLDHNDVWGNSLGDYHGIAAGKNDISKDPSFKSATDFHLTKLSPCVDAIPATHLPASIVTDVDGDSRRIDGNSDGLSGNGARLDIGADEYGEAFLTLNGEPKLGTTVSFRVQAPDLRRYISLLGFTTGATLVEPFGYLMLGSNSLVLGVGVSGRPDPWRIPNAAALAGLMTYHQAVVLPFPVSLFDQMTNRVDVTMR